MMAKGFLISDLVGWRLEVSRQSRKCVIVLFLQHAPCALITTHTQPGNPRPRVFHLPEDSALINRYGFPSQGLVSVLSRICARLPTFPSTIEEHWASLRQGRLLAINLGKNKESPQESPDDFVVGVHAFAPHVDVIVVNVSSPNTPGLRYVTPFIESSFFLSGSSVTVVCNSETC